MTTTKTDIFCAILILIILLFYIYSHFFAQKSENKSPKGLGVRDLISTVKSELVQAEQDRLNRGDAPLLELKEFNLEVKFVVSEGEKVNGQISPQFITVGKESTYSQEKIQTINIKMAVAKSQNKSSPPSDIKEDSTSISENPPPDKKNSIL